MTSSLGYPVTPITELDRRADEAARIVHRALYPQFSQEVVPVFYAKAAKIIIQAIEDGLV